MGFPGDNALTLNKEMVGSWLIQRLHKPYNSDKDNPFSFGGGLKNGGMSDNAMDLIRSIFTFDYMGASEFEWGAVPQALKFLAQQAGRNNLLAKHIELNKNEMVYVIAPTEYLIEAIKRIELLRVNKLRLKEWIGLNSYFDRKEDFAKRNCGWIELDNGFMFFTDKDMFEKTCKLFGIKV